MILNDYIFLSLTHSGVLSFPIGRSTMLMLASHASVVEPIAAALDVFNELRDAEDFVDTLQRISACRDEIDIPTIHSAVEDEPTEAEVRSSPTAALEQGERQAEANLLQVIASLALEKHVTEAQSDALGEYVRMRHPFVMAAHDVFLTDGDVEEMMDTLLHIAQRVVWKDGEGEDGLDDVSEEEEEEEEEDSSDYAYN